MAFVMLRPFRHLGPQPKLKDFTLIILIKMEIFMIGIDKNGFATQLPDSTEDTLFHAELLQNINYIQMNYGQLHENH